jgi:hypothetical protein
MQLQTLYEKGLVVDGVGKRVKPIAQEGDGVFGYHLLRTPENEYYIAHKSPVLGASGVRKVTLKGIIYIAGPMRGLPYHNFPAFDDATTKYAWNGFYVFNPADFDRQMGMTENTSDADVTDDVLRACLDRDLNAITKSTHIALLPGWENSRGVRPEAVLAFTLGLRFIDDSDNEEVPGIAVMGVVGARLLGGYQEWEQKQVAAGSRTYCGCGEGRTCVSCGTNGERDDKTTISLEDQAKLNEVLAKANSESKPNFASGNGLSD